MWSLCKQVFTYLRKLSNVYFERIRRIGYWNGATTTKIENKYLFCRPQNGMSAREWNE